MAVMTIDVEAFLIPEGVLVRLNQRSHQIVPFTSLRPVAGLDDVAALEIAEALEGITRDIRNTIEFTHAMKDWSE